jgi:uncharacterized protein YcbK (DUF882 family)
MVSKSPSDNLSWNELSCKDGTPYPVQWRNNRAIQLANVFEMVRLFFNNKPIIIYSAYRTPSWNSYIGGARNSQHIQGRALDLHNPDTILIEDFYAEIKNLANLDTSNIGGIGLYRTFVHVDIRPKVNNHIAYWSGDGLKDSLG